MTKMWSGGLEYNVTGQGFDPTKGAVFRAGVVAAPGSNSNRELGVRSTLLAALLCCDTQLLLGGGMGEDGDHNRMGPPR